MAGVRRRGDLGADDARRASGQLGRELRETRLASGLSQATVARAASLSPAQVGRLERGEIRRPNLDQLARCARSLGLELSARLYPVGAPVRDAGQLALLGRFERCLGVPLRLIREEPLPLAADQRAWDGVIHGGGQPCFVEAETRIGDVQALERRIRLKQRDDPRATVVLLVAARSGHNRTIITAHREALRELLPLDGAAVLRALRAGRCPPTGGIVVV